MSCFLRGSHNQDEPANFNKYRIFGQIGFIGYMYSGTSLRGHLSIKDTSSGPKLVVSIQFDLSNQDTSLLRTALVSPKGVLNREVLL